MLCKGNKPQILAFPENRYEALEESRKLLGLTKEEFNSFLKVLCKSDRGDIQFDFGSLKLSFVVFHNKFSLTFILKNDYLDMLVEYKFKLDDIEPPKKQRIFEDLENK